MPRAFSILKRKKIDSRGCLWGFLTLLVWHTSLAQVSRFSQYETVPMLLNPALAGTVPDLTVNANYRLQRLGQTNYQTGYFSAMFPLYQQGQEATQGGGLALSAAHDMAGEFGEVKTFELHFTGAYNLPLDKYHTQLVSLGLQGGYVQTRIDFGSLNWPSQITYNGFDPSKVVAMDQYEQQFGFFDISAGVFWKYNPGNNPFRENHKFKLYSGFSVANLNKPTRGLVQGSNSQVPLLFRIHGGSEHFVNDHVSIAPNFLVQSQYHIIQYSIGTTLRLAQEVSTPSNPKLSRLVIDLGAWYRLSDAAVFLVGLGNRKFDAALSYDVIASRERAAIYNQQAFELSLAYRFLKNNEPKKFSTPLF